MTRQKIDNLLRSHFIRHYNSACERLPWRLAISEAWEKTVRLKTWLFTRYVHLWTMGER